jgi:hypothetical protein
VAQFIMVRDEIEQMERAFKEQVAPYNDLKDKLVGEMLAFLEHTGQKSAVTANGRVTLQVKDYASCSDPDRFMDFVFEHGLRDLIDRRANATACKDYANEHDGVLPPGVKLTTKRSVGVTRP